LAAENVDELRHFIEAGRAHDPADARDPAVAHRSEFQNAKGPEPAAAAVLSKEHRPSVVHDDGGGNHRHDGPEHHQPGGRSDHIEQALRSRHVILLYITKYFMNRARTRP